MSTIATTKDASTQAKIRMEKAVEDFRKELGTIRTGRANVSLLDHVRVDYHGTPMAINQLGTMTVPDGTMIVISPFTQKNYVSHTAADTTAILAFIEDRFGLQPLTQRDASQTNMEEFFNFQTPPWATPPTNIPAQPTSGTCNPAQLGYTPGS